RLGWKLGDELVFNVGGQTFSAPITSFRRVRWDSMKVNFFVIAPPAILGRFPASYISAFRVDASGEAGLRALAAQFPNLTLVDIGPLAGLALLSINAWLSSRKVLRASPALTLRESV